MHNYVHHSNKLPVVFSTYFEENKVIHKYNTMQKDYFHIDAIKSEIGKRSIIYKGSKLWNDLPAELKEIESFQAFKYKLKKVFTAIFDMLVAVKCCTCWLPPAPPCLIVSVFLSAC